jgi:hypothetical protein
MSRLTTVLLTAAVAFPLGITAASVSLPNTFSNGTVADADAVNANFAAVSAAVDDNDARLTALPLTVDGSDLTLSGDLTVAGDVSGPNHRRVVATLDADGSYDLQDLFTAGRNDGMRPGLWDRTLKTTNGAHWKGYRFTAAVNFYDDPTSWPHRYYNVAQRDAHPSGCSGTLTLNGSTGAITFTRGSCSETARLMCTEV